jgi:hypothetical protein
MRKKIDALKRKILDYFGLITKDEIGFIIRNKNEEVCVVVDKALDIIRTQSETIEENYYFHNRRLEQEIQMVHWGINNPPKLLIGCTHVFGSGRPNAKVKQIELIKSDCALGLPEFDYIYKMECLETGTIFNHLDSQIQRSI